MQKVVVFIIVFNFSIKIITDINFLIGFMVSLVINFFLIYFLHSTRSYKLVLELQDGKIFPGLSALEYFVKSLRLCISQKKLSIS